MPDHHRRAVAGALTVLALTAACDGAPPTAPARSDNAAFRMSPADSAGFAVALEDVRARILPALAGTDAARSLGESLDVLGRAMQVRDAHEVQRAVERAARALDAPVSEDAQAELQVIRLVLAQAHALASGSDAAR